MVWGRHLRSELRGAVIGLLAFVLLLPSALGVLTTTELAREQALYSELQRSLCAGSGSVDGRHDGAPTPLSGCDYCCSACTVGCAVPVAGATEIGRRAVQLPIRLRLVLAELQVDRAGRPGDRLPRGPPVS